MQSQEHGSADRRRWQHRILITVGVFGFLLMGVVGVLNNGASVLAGAEIRDGKFLIAARGRVNSHKISVGKLTFIVSALGSCLWPPVACYFIMRRTLANRKDNKDSPQWALIVFFSVVILLVLLNTIRCIIQGVLALITY